MGFLDGALGDLVERLQHFHGALGLFLGAVHLELLVAVGDLDVERGLDDAQVLVGRAAEVGEAGVVGRGEEVAQNQLIIP
jgi:hypothetical protein